SPCHSTAYRLLTANRGRPAMPTGTVSKRFVDALKCDKGDRVFLWDDGLEGYGVCAFPSGKKVFVCQFRLNGRSRRITLGTYGEKFTPKQARTRAKRVLGAVADGKDP